MTERVQKIIARAGVCSRRAAEDLLRAGRVCINGAVAALGDQADAGVDEQRRPSIGQPHGALRGGK